MITTRDSSTMTEAERFAEIASILATGYLRLQLSRPSPENGLAESRQSEASCGSKATNPKSDEDAA